MIHERLAYWIGRQIGAVPTSRGNHSWVTMNGSCSGSTPRSRRPRRR